MSEYMAQKMDDEIEGSIRTHEELLAENARLREQVADLEWRRNGLDVAMETRERDNNRLRIELAAAQAAGKAAPERLDIFEAYKDWPSDIREKLSMHDLRRMGGWAARPTGAWALDHSAGTPILVYENCSVIEDDQARYVLSLIAADAALAAAPPPAAAQAPEPQELRTEFPARYMASGPAGELWCDDFNLIRRTVGLLDLDEEWTVTDTQAEPVDAAIAADAAKVKR